MKRMLRIFAIVFALVAIQSLAPACPTCRNALAQGSAGWAHGFASGIAVLLGVMFSAAATFAFAVWRATRSAA